MPELLAFLYEFKLGVVKTITDDKIKTVIYHLSKVGLHSQLPFSISNTQV
jgi:hypothetical protein